MYLETLEKLDIELTNLCNSKCLYYLRVSPNYLTKKINLDSVEHILKIITLKMERLSL